MKQIWKFPIDEREPNEYGGYLIEVPEGTRFISTILQNNEIVVYGEVDTDLIDKVTRKILVLGTGKSTNEILALYTFLGTVIQGPFVWHIYAEA